MKLYDKTFTADFMRDNCGCYSPMKDNKLKDCSFMRIDSITAESILNSEIPTRDKYWFFCRKVFTKEQNQRIAIECAKTVLHLFENKYPEDKRVRKAIEAAENYLDGKISREELIGARRAAYAAAAAADAAAAAAAAAAADAAAADAADADAAAAAAAAAAADAAAADAADADAYAALKQQLLNILIEFCKTNESA